MKYKAIFFDLDGTPVPVYADKPTDKVIKTVKKAKGKIHFSFAIGRVLKQTINIIKLLDLTDPIVISNGIQIFDPKTNKIIRQHQLPQKYIQTIYKLLNKYQLKIFKFDGAGIQEFDPDAGNKDTLSMYVDLVQPEITDKIMMELSHISELATHKMIAWQKEDPKLTSLEICNSQATKLYGIQEVAKMLDIDTKEIIGVGDSYNDFPLLLACGLKIAMGNAVEELKAIADFVAPSVDDDGAVTVIEKFILNQ